VVLVLILPAGAREGPAAPTQYQTPVQPFPYAIPDFFTFRPPAAARAESR